MIGYMKPTRTRWGIHVPGMLVFHPESYQHTRTYLVRYNITINSSGRLAVAAEDIRSSDVKLPIGCRSLYTDKSYVTYSKFRSRATNRLP